MRKFICALLTLILTVGALFSCGGKDSSGKIQKPDGDAASLLLALQRLDSKALSEGNLLDSGKDVLMALSDTVNGFVTLMGKDTVHDHGEHGRVTVSGDTYIWDNLGDYSNYYSYFENITGNVSSTALQGATMIDGFKDNVRVVDKWVESSEQYYLTVSENSETLFTRDTDGNVRLCRRYKNEKGQNVYELYFTDKAQTMRTRMAYIPDSVIEYSYTYTGDGEPFHHDFFA